jgi:ABC-type antimicrobial peptide transport system permease subunit
MAIGAIFGAMNTMYAAVGQRTREIAVLLMLGFTPGAVMLSFLFESVLLALIGGALGCLLALPINGITTSTTNWSSFSEIAFAFRVTPVGMGLGLAFAALMGVVGGFLPARLAARQSLAATLRGA